MSCANYTGLFSLVFGAPRRGTTIDRVLIRAHSSKNPFIASDFTTSEQLACVEVLNIGGFAARL